MSDLPSGWEWTTLEQVCSILDHRRIPVKAANRTSGDVPYYGATGRVGSIDKALFDETLVLLGEDGVPFLDARKAKAYLITGPSWVNNHAHVLRPLGKVNALYLMHTLNLVDFQPHVTGTTRLKLPKSSMLRITFPLPPLAEQNRIVNELERLASLAVKGRQALYGAACKIPTLQRSARRTHLQRDRPPGRLADVVERIEAGRSGGGSAPPARNDEWGVVKISSMTWGEFVAEENKRVVEEFVDPRYEIHEGDILVSRANTAAYVGAPVLVGPVRPKLLLSDKSLRIVPKADIDRRWLLHCLASPQFRAYVSATATGTKDSMRNISQSALLAGPVHVLEPDEQRRVADAIDDQMSQAHRLERATNTLEVRADALRRSILSEALAGRLLAQDANDEPARVVLDRIRAEPVAPHQTLTKPS